MHTSHTLHGNDSLTFNHFLGNLLHRLLSEQYWHSYQTENVFCGAGCMLCYVVIISVIWCILLYCHVVMEFSFQIIEATVKLELKKKDIEQLLENERQLWKEFKELISDDKFAEYLTKVYKKKIRRSKKKVANGPGMCRIKTVCAAELKTNYIFTVFM